MRESEHDTMGRPYGARAWASALPLLRFRPIALTIILLLMGSSAAGQTIKVSPTGVNVNPSAPNTVFLTYAQLRNHRPAEAQWCGDVIPAAPDLGFKCHPATIFGSLPARFDQSRRSGNQAFTDVMSIPASVVRRAYQAAANGEESRFFYIRRFINTAGGPDEYVGVTCRLAGGGARVPLALTDVKLVFEPDIPLLLIRADAPVPPIRASIGYNGTGRLKGRWEVVMPGDEPPADTDLLTEATLPFEERSRQRRYTQLGRFNIFLPPTGRITLAGPDVKLLPRTIEGQYMLLLRIEASDDREGDSDLGAIGAGPDVVHSGAVAGFPLPVLRYFVGAGSSQPGITMLSPADNYAMPHEGQIVFAWQESSVTQLVRLEVIDARDEEVLSALLPPGIGRYHAPSWLREQSGVLRWRVVAHGQTGEPLTATPWRTLQIAPATPSR